MSINPQHFITGELLSPGPTGPLLWRVRFGGSVLEAHLCEVGCWGFAYRLYLNRRFTYSERFKSEDEARQAAEGVLASRVGDGWMADGSIWQTV